MGEVVRRCLGVFYADDNIVGPREFKWIQHLMNVLVGLFFQYDLAANVVKSRTMTCQPSALRSRMSDVEKYLE